MFNNLFIEKYRPKTLADCILADDMRAVVENWRKTKEIPNIMFAGNAGGGKTTLAKIIVNEILDCQYLYINASDENGIDTIRYKIGNFAQTRSIDGKIKVVILDEADGLSAEGMRALRNTMEEYAENVRFILTCNAKYRIIGPIQSRTQTFELVPPLAGCVERVKYILAQEKITFTADQGPKLRALIQNSYPDMRSVINNLQKNIIGNTLNVVFISNSFKFAEGTLAMLPKVSDPSDLRRYLAENDQEFNKDYPGLLRSLFNAVDKTSLSVDVKRKYILILAEGMYRCAFVMDQEINAYATLIALLDIK
jgi:replication factor C small subunit